LGRGHLLSRISQVALTVVGGLLIVPTAVNVATGGTPPAWLAPYSGWLWPAAIVSTMVIIALEVWDRVRRSGQTFSVRRPDHPRNVRLALVQVTRHVEDRRRRSLLGDTDLVLEFDEVADAVDGPGHLVRRVEGLPTGLSITEVFEQLSDSLLLLGAAGGGKTTLLLKLASAFLDRADPVGRPVIPVIVDLSGWTRQPDVAMAARLRRPVRTRPDDFTTWLLTTIQDIYGIPEAVGRTWLQDNRFVLLFDGLDEVRREDRGRCVEEINLLQSRAGATNIAVSSRTEEYQELSVRLRLQGAVAVRPLTRMQARAVLREPVDEGLWELLTTPLMLGILVSARSGVASSHILDVKYAGLRSRLLLDAFVVELLAKRRSSHVGSPELFLRALRTLATASRRTGSGVRLARIDGHSIWRLLPEEAAEAAVHRLLPVCGAAVMFVACAAMGRQFSLAAGVVPLVVGYFLLGDVIKDVRTAARPLVLATAALIAAIAAAGVAMLATTLMRIFLRLPFTIVATVVVAAFLAAVVLLWRVLEKDWWDVVPLALPGAVITYLMLVLDPRSALLGWAAGFGAGLCLFSIGVGTDEDKAKRRGDRVPPPSRARTLRYVLPSAVVLVVSSTSWFTPFWLPALGWLVGLALLMPAAVYVGRPLVSLYVRGALAAAEEPNPWRPSFLGKAADRGLLARVDGEYQFTHMLVRDHLADCNASRLAIAVTRRKAAV